MPITPIHKTAYVVEKGNDLREEIENFFETISANGELDRIFEEKFGFAYSPYYRQIPQSSKLDEKVGDLDSILESKTINLTVLASTPVVISFEVVTTVGYFS